MFPRGYFPEPDSNAPHSYLTDWSIAIKKPGALNFGELRWMSLVSRAMDSSSAAVGKRLTLSISILEPPLKCQDEIADLGVYLIENERFKSLA